MKRLGSLLKNVSGLRVPVLCFALPALLTLAGCAQKAPSDGASDDLAEHVVKRVPQEGVNATFADFGGKLHLVGYTLEPDQEVRGGDKVKLKLYWSAVGALQPGYRISTFVLAGKRVDTFESGGPLRAPESGPSAWRPGRIYVDEQEFELPADLRGKEIAIAVGVSRDALPVEKPSADASDETKVDEGSASEIIRPALRLPVISGPSDGSERAIIAHLTYLPAAKAKPRPRRLPNAAAAARPQAPAP